MGWGNCGTDSRGRPIGYMFGATCDEPGCDVKIDRGLSYACGNMHGETDVGCEKYFCEQHRSNLIQPAVGSGRLVSICNACAKECVASELYYEDENEGMLVPCKEHDVLTCE